ncbi:MAG TPA: hypothetical protein VF081_12035 [Solirubrobacterales bacterium]
MNARIGIASLCMLCALLSSAFAAQSASAITGTTAFTCVQEQGTLRGEHCLATGTAWPAFGHVAIPQNDTTETTTTNAKTGPETTTASGLRLKQTIAGVPLELSATGVSGSGWIENKVVASGEKGGEHYAHGKGTLTFTGVEVTQPAGRGCKATTDNAATEGEVGVVHSKELTAITEGQNWKFLPAEGNVLASFFVTCEEGKQIPTIEGTWSVTGSVKGAPEGATIKFTHTSTTAEATLRTKGVKAGLEGNLTLSARANGGNLYWPVASTTVTT